MCSTSLKTLKMSFKTWIWIFETLCVHFKWTKYVKIMFILQTNQCIVDLVSYEFVFFYLVWAYCPSCVVCSELKDFFGCLKTSKLWIMSGNRHWRNPCENPFKTSCILWELGWKSCFCRRYFKAAVPEISCGTVKLLIANSIRLQLSRSLLNILNVQAN